MPKLPLRRAIRRLHCLLLGLLMTSQTLAGDLASQPLRDQQQQLQRFEHEQRLRQWERRGRDVEPAPAQDRATTNAACWPVSGVRLYGNRILSAQMLDGPVQRELRPCMDVEAINGLLKSITQRYVAAGYPTSRPLLLRQPSAGAPLDIRIVEGFVESIELSDRDQPLSLRGAFPGLLGEPLYLPDLEQGLDQLNRLPGFEVSMDLLPGELEGGTRVIVQPQRSSRRWRFNSTLDNLGSDYLGVHRLFSSVTIDSPFAENGSLQLAFHNTSGDALGSSAGPAFRYDVPYGPWNFALSAIALESRSTTRDPHHVLEGSTRAYQFDVERVLWRNQQGMLSARLRLPHRQLEQRIDGARIGNQSVRSTHIEMGLNLLWLEGGLWNAYAGVAQGLDWFNADRVAKGDSKPLFRAYRASLMHLRQRPPQHPWRWQSEIDLQYSADRVPTTDQLYLGGSNAVRGFRESPISYSSAALWRNTLSYPLPIALPGNLELRPHLGVDHGWARASRTEPSQRLAGAAVGMTLALPRSHLTLDYQRPLHATGKRHQDLDPGYWVVQWALTI
ncbi:Hemolysin transporter protein ShlB [Pseudomonas fluorescens]|uniref:ShlB/FhaC/HecB family hemolysin secretion/activation protein n=1 Tax=Pseudomonas fluorescens TaxID=294 RepID=UPI00125796E3|nr:ShlB/FhaC/HecB family hemolysin secretion/activation protein [Pseudomonas fluorescens]CAG8866035.1 Hemolysin transporter protein ShlB [Pseudomonas fluorescens]